MKMLPCLLAAFALAACGKTSEVNELHQEAMSLAKYYQPRINDLMKRANTIVQHSNVPPDAPGLNDARKKLSEAGKQLTDLCTFASPDHCGTIASGGRSELEKQADELAKAGNVAELEKLVDERRAQLDEGTTAINDAFTTVENWLAQTEAHARLAPPAAPPAPTPAEATPPAPATEPGAATGSATK